MAAGEGRSPGLRKAYERFIKIRDTPREIALGLALGIFIGMMPILGLQTVSAVLLASLLRWNKVSAAIGTLVTNPLTIPLVYALTYSLGSSILALHGTRPEMTGAGFGTLLEIGRRAPEILWALFLGGVFVGLPLGILSYLFARKTVERYQDEVRQRLARQRERLREKRQRLAQRTKQLRERASRTTARRKKQKSRKRPPRRAR